MTLRDATAADAAALSALESECFPDDAWSGASLASHLETPLCLACLLEEGGEVIGYASGRALPPEAEVYRVAVRPDARRRGIGLALMGALELRLPGMAVTVSFWKSVHRIPPRGACTNPSVMRRSACAAVTTARPSRTRFCMKKFSVRRREPFPYVSDRF